MEEILSVLYYWIDVIWLPIAFFAVHKRHRWWSVAFVFTCMLMMRMQIELVTYGGFDTGIMGFVEMDVYTRGLITYSVFYALFLLMAYFSPRTQGVVFMGACLAIFFFAFVTSTAVMVL